MDIDLLSKMVKELILDNDKVVLPGLGSFVAEVVPSTFSDKGYTINPPYRRLYFRSKPDEGHALVDFYSVSNKVDREIADKVIRDFVSELKEILFSRKTVVFPGLGRLRATKENAVFFVADEDLDIYPEGFALEPISLKTHVETKEEVRTMVEELKSMVEEPASVESAETVAPEEIGDDVPETVVPEEIGDDVPETVAPDENVDDTSMTVVPEEVVDDTSVAVVPEETVEDVSEDIDSEDAVGEVTEDVTVETVEAKALNDAAIRESVEEIKEDITEKEVRKTGLWRKFAITLLATVAVAALLLVAFVVLARYMPDTVDRILYTPEELEIINR